MNSWVKRTLKEAAIDIIDGDRGVNYPKKNEFNSTGYCLFLNTGNVTKSGFDFSNKSFITVQKDKLLRKGKLERGDIVLTTRGTLGNVGYFNDEIAYSNIRINSGMVILRVDENKISPYYLYLFLRSGLFNNQVLKQGSGSAQPQLPIQNLNNIVFPWFNLKNQKAIAKVLSDLDAKIEVNNNINQELEAMAKTLYDYWFVQFDFPDANGNPYKSSGGEMVYNEVLKREIPEGWERQKIKDIAKTGSGGTPLKSKKGYYENGNIPWINSGEVNASFIISTKKYISKLGLDKSSAKLFKRGTILMAMYGATAGQVSLMDLEACTNQAICGINPNENEFIYYTKFSLEDMYQYLISLSTGSARDNLSQDKIKELNIVVPNRTLLANFHNKVHPNFDKILLNLKQNQKLAELRDWLLPMLMNGQVSVGEVKEQINMAAEHGEKYNII